MTDHIDTLSSCKNYTFYGIEAQVYMAENTTVYPWRFRIKKPSTGKWSHYAGIPNKCDTARSAMMRAKWRCKWMADGVYDEIYVPDRAGQD